MVVKTIDSDQHKVRLNIVHKLAVFFVLLLFTRFCLFNVKCDFVLLLCACFFAYFHSLHQNPKWGFLLTLSGFAMTIGTAIPVGYNLGVTNSPAEYIQKWCNESLIERYDLHLSSEEIQVLWASIVSIFTIGGCIGSLVAAIIADKFGRKGSLLICGIMFAIGAVLLYFCRSLQSVEMLFIARLIVGLSSGITTAVLAMYLAEIAPSELRGTLATFSGMGMLNKLILFVVFFLKVCY